MPNWLAFNPATGKPRCMLATPWPWPVLYKADVHAFPCRSPWSFDACRLREYYRMHLDNGRFGGYAGVLTHNPGAHGKLSGCRRLRETPWTLPELAEPIPKRWRIPAKPTTPVWRNGFVVSGRNGPDAGREPANFPEPLNRSPCPDYGIFHRGVDMDDVPIGGYGSRLDDGATARAVR